MHKHGTNTKPLGLTLGSWLDHRAQTWHKYGTSMAQAWLMAKIVRDGVRFLRGASISHCATFLTSK